MKIDTITSTQNPKIKMLAGLQRKSKMRKEQNIFVVEGMREVIRSIESGFVPISIFVCVSILGEKNLQIIQNKANRANSDGYFIMIPEALYRKVAYREGTEGIIAEFKCKEHRLENLKLGNSPLIAVMESVEKPGNLGAVLRTADAAGADAVIVCDPLTDIYNPNIIRASTGAMFSEQLALASSEETIGMLKKNKIKICTAQLQDSKLYYDTDMTGGTAIVFGTESAGLTEIWRNAADEHIRIPMAGKADSLNVSAAASILLFEAVRQRNTLK